MSRRVRIFEGARPGHGRGPGVAVYTPLHAGDVAIGVLVDAMGLPRAPKVSEIFDRSFLPPLGERPKRVVA